MTLDFSSIALADEATQEAGRQPSMIENLIPFLFVFVIMYFLLIRPQTKKAKEHLNLLKSLKPGDEVVTSGGIIGRVKSIADEFVSLDVGAGQIKILKENITRLTKAAAGKPPADDKKDKSDK